MSFAEPLFLLGIVAGLVPVILHLMHRQRARLVPISTLRFLKPCVQKTRRRKVIQDLLLLLARVVVLVLIALALARPAVRAARGFLGGGSNQSVVLVVDNSASMAAEEGPETRLDRAIAAARSALALLKPGDEAAIVFPCGAPDAAEGEFHTDLGVIYEALGRCRAVGSAYSAATLLHQVRELLAQARHKQQEVYIFTDLQEANWKDVDDAAGLADSARIFLVKVSTGTPPNVAITALRVTGAGPLIHLPCTVTARVENSGPHTQQRHVELFVAGKRVAGSPTLNLLAGQHELVQLTFKPTRPGLLSGRVYLAGEDGLPLDNSRYFVWNVASRVRVLLVCEQENIQDYSNDAFYVAQLLALDYPNRWPIRWKRINPTELAGEPLAGYDLVCVIGAQTVRDRDTGDKLERFVRDGGHVVWTPANRDAVSDWENAKRWCPHLLPGRPIALHSASAENVAGGWTFAWLDTDGDLFRPLRIEPEQLTDVRIFRYFEWDTAEGGFSAATLSNGQPLLMRTAFGQGTVCLFTVVPHLDWTTLPVHPVFVPLFSRLVFAAAENAVQARHDLVAGRPFQFPPPAADLTDSVDVISPDGVVHRLEASGNRQQPQFVFTDTHAVGTYSVSRPDDPAHRPLLKFAVNMDPAESDLSPLPVEMIERWCEQTGANLVSDLTKLGETVQRVRRGTELWPPLLIAVLLLMVLEAFQANWAGKSASTPRPGGARHGGEGGDVATAPWVEEMERELRRSREARRPQRQRKTLSAS